MMFVYVLARLVVMSRGKKALPPPQQQRTRMFCLGRTFIQRDKYNTHMLCEVSHFASTWFGVMGCTRHKSI